MLGRHTELDEVPNGAHDCVLLAFVVCHVSERGWGQKGGRTQETDTDGLGDLDEFATVGWKTGGGVSSWCTVGSPWWWMEEGIRFSARLMNWMPSLRNSRGTSRISCTWSAIVFGRLEGIGDGY